MKVPMRGADSFILNKSLIPSPQHSSEPLVTFLPSSISTSILNTTLTSLITDSIPSINIIILFPFNPFLPIERNTTPHPTRIPPIINSRSPHIVVTTIITLSNRKSKLVISPRSIQLLSIRTLLLLVTSEDLEIENVAVITRLVGYIAPATTGPLDPVQGSEFESAELLDRGQCQSLYKHLLKV